MKNWIAIGVVMLTLATFVPRPIETATPAIVNPTGWNKADVISHIGSIIKECDKADSTKGSINRVLMRKVCVLPPAMYIDISDKILLFHDSDIDKFKKYIKMLCQNYKEALK